MRHGALGELDHADGAVLWVVVCGDLHEAALGAVHQPRSTDKAISDSLNLAVGVQRTIKLQVIKGGSEEPSTL